MTAERAGWEYRVETGHDESAARLNGIGAEGWELVSVLHRGGLGVTQYFKRPLNLDTFGRQAEVLAVGSGPTEQLDEDQDDTTSPATLEQLAKDIDAEIEAIDQEVKARDAEVEIVNGNTVRPREGGKSKGRNRR